MKKVSVAPSVAYILKDQTKDITAFYTFNLGHGPGNSDEVWRIHATPATIEAIITGLQLEPASSIPPEFWELAPSDWPRAPISNTTSFQSPGFNPTRLIEPVKYFLLFDKNQNIAYVWERSTM